MKRLRTLVLVALVAMLGIAMTACSGNGYNNKEARELVKKAKKGKLKKADYAKIIDWYEMATEEFTDQYEKIVKENDDYDDFELAATELTKRFAGKYPHLDALFSVLYAASEEDMGASNYKKSQKLQEKFNKRIEKLNDRAPKSDEDGGMFGNISNDAASDSAVVEEEVEVYEEPVPVEVYEEVPDSAVAM